MGVGITLVLLAIRAKQVGEELKMIEQMEWIGSRVGGPSVIVSLGTGTWMVVRSNAWQFNQGWILGGLIILAILFFMGVGFHVPQYKRIRLAIEKHGEESPVVQQLIGRSFTAAQLEVVLLVIVILLMVFKPGI
jgi:uncharacterized membrane protein